jgi:hypothetical protein
LRDRNSGEIIRLRRNRRSVSERRLSTPNMATQQPSKIRQAFESTILSLEKKRKSRIYVVVHNSQGARTHLCGPDFRTLYKNRSQFNGIETLEVLLHSPGGHADMAYRMARFFKSHCKRLHIIVPLTAKSAATLLALAGDKIYMGELADLGPLDVQITDELERGTRPFSPLDEFKSMEFLREYATEFLDYFAFALSQRGMSVKQSLHEAIPAVSGMMAPLYSHIDPSKVGSFRRSLAEAEDYAVRLLKQSKNPYAEELVEQLVWKYPVHDFVIDYPEAKELGLPVVRLEASHEKLLNNALLEMVTNGLSYCGFVSAPPSTGKGGKKSGNKRMPTEIGNEKPEAA